MGATKIQKISEALLLQRPLTVHLPCHSRSAAKWRVSQWAAFQDCSPSFYRWGKWPRKAKWLRGYVKNQWDRKDVTETSDVWVAGNQDKPMSFNKLPLDSLFIQPLKARNSSLSANSVRSLPSLSPNVHINTYSFCGTHLPRNRFHIDLGVGAQGSCAKGEMGGLASGDVSLAPHTVLCDTWSLQAPGFRFSGNRLPTRSCLWVVWVCDLTFLRTFSWPNDWLLCVLVCSL